MRKLAVAVLALLFVTGCATMGKPAATGLIGAGTTLDAVGVAFTQAGPVFKAGCDGTTRTIDAATCEQFRSFGERFKVDYQRALSAYKVAVATNDAVAAHNALAQATTLSTQLATVTLQSKKGGR